jgi:hypothetical protein
MFQLWGPKGRPCNAFGNGISGEIGRRGDQSPGENEAIFRSAFPCRNQLPRLS